MKEFRIGNMPRAEVELWCYHNIGVGGNRLQKAFGCEEFEDQWDGDEWQLHNGFFGTSILIKDDAKAVLFALRWS